MTTFRAGLFFALLALGGCGKKDAGGSGNSSGLPWTPTNYASMTASCKKALACCEAVAQAAGVKTAMDFNGKCSGPAIWKDSDCAEDLRMRGVMAQGSSAPLPDACT
jgi:hypothetical protein